MKIFANKSIWKKIVLVLLFITVFAFVAPQPTQASIGGALMDPICDFLTTVGDAVVNVVHKVILKQDTTLVRVDTNASITTILKIATVVLGIVVVAAAIFLGAGITAGVIIRLLTGAAFKFAVSGALIALSIGRRSLGRL